MKSRDDTQMKWIEAKRVRFCHPRGETSKDSERELELRLVASRTIMFCRDQNRVLERGAIASEPCARINSRRDMMNHVTTRSGCS